MTSEPPDHDDQEVAEAIDEETLGEEDLVADGLRAHDLDLVDSITDRADRESPDFDRLRPGVEPVAQQIVASAPEGGTRVESDVLGAELPGDGSLSPEEEAIHVTDRVNGDRPPG